MQTDCEQQMKDMLRNELGVCECCLDKVFEAFKSDLLSDSELIEEASLRSVDRKTTQTAHRHLKLVSNE